MVEYIKREDVLSVVDYIRTKYISIYNRKSKTNQFWTDTIRYFEKKTMAIPAADVAEVRHGKWVVLKSGQDCICSACERYWIATDDQYDFNYCPYCGAEMCGK